MGTHDHEVLLYNYKLYVIGRDLRGSNVAVYVRSSSSVTVLNTVTVLYSFDVTAP